MTTTSLPMQMPYMAAVSSISNRTDTGIPAVASSVGPINGGDNLERVAKDMKAQDIPKIMNDSQGNKNRPDIPDPAPQQIPHRHQHSVSLDLSHVPTSATIESLNTAVPFQFPTNSDDFRAVSAQTMSSNTTSTPSQAPMPHYAMGHAHTQPLPLPYHQQHPAMSNSFLQAGPSFASPFPSFQDFHFGNVLQENLPLSQQQHLHQRPPLQPLMPQQQQLQQNHPSQPPIINRASSDEWQTQDWEDEPDSDRNDMASGAEVIVKHRRRTSPQQLQILEEAYAINNKPSNDAREHLAYATGMSKRNVQVWFQNRRAKMKTLAIKEKDARGDGSASGHGKGHPSQGFPQILHRLPMPPQGVFIPNSNGSTFGQAPLYASTSFSLQPPPPHQPVPASAGPSNSHMTSLLPPAWLNMNRRVSLANGEAADIHSWARKHELQGRPRPYGLQLRSPSISQGAALRRSSTPYPSPMGSHPSPYGSRGSPSVRPSPSNLHLTAMTNTAQNNRRLSMPGSQLIHSSPFTPPRNNNNGLGMNGNHNANNGGINHNVNGSRELGEIKDEGGSGETEPMNLSAFVTPNTNTYRVPFNTLATPSNQIFSDPFPSFTQADSAFQSRGQPPQLSPDDQALQDLNLYMSMYRDRMDSISSHTTEEVSDMGGDMFNQSLEQTGTSTESRRNSGAGELLELKKLGITSMPINNAQPLRPSPLNSHFTSDTLASMPSMASIGSLDHSTFSFQSPVIDMTQSSSSEPSPNSAESNPQASQMNMYPMGAVPPHPMRSQTMPDYQFNYQVTDTSQLGFDNMSMDTSNQFIYSNPPTMPMLLGNNGRAHSDPSMPPSGLSAEDDFFFQLSDNPDFQLIAQT